MSHSLLVSKGTDAGRKFPLGKAEIFIGRDRANFVCIPEIKVSRRHCRISFLRGKYVLDDLKSSNGSFVNDQPVRHCQLTTGDRIRVGSTEFVFQSGSNADPFSEGRSADIELIDDQPESECEAKSSDLTSLSRHRKTQGEKTPVERIKGTDSSSSLLDPISGLPASRLEEDSSYYDRVTDVREASRRFIQVGNDLRFIYHTSLATSRSADRERMLEEILQLIFDWIAADRGCVFLKDDRSNSLDMKLFKCRTELEGLEFRVSRSIVNYVRKKVGVLSSRAAKDQRWGAQPSILHTKTGEVLCVPIQGRDELLGLIYLDTLVGAGDDDESSRFNEDHLKLLVAMAHQTAVAIENEAYYAALLEKERLAAIGETTGVIAHHVKNVLQGIIGGTHVVEAGLRANDFDVIGKGWQIVNRNQEQISRLVTDMLLLASPFQPHCEVADANLAIQDAIDQLQPQLAAQQTVCQFNANRELKAFYFDRASFSSAVLHIINLSMLACKSMDSKGLIQVSISEKKGNAVLTIIDNGVQIDVSPTEEVLDPLGFGDDQKIFGVGLAVSRKIIAGHRGTLAVLHPKRLGNKFVIKLPLNK